MRILLTILLFFLLPETATHAEADLYNTFEEMIIRETPQYLEMTCNEREELRTVYKYTYLKY